MIRYNFESSMINKTKNNLIMQQLILTLVLFFSSILLSHSQNEQKTLVGEVISISDINLLKEDGRGCFAFYNREILIKGPLFIKSAILENPHEEFNSNICFQDEVGNNSLDLLKTCLP
mgnify:FL=1|jgi:O-phosphoseryl-tRNA(Cys) synthetase